MSDGYCDNKLLYQKCHEALVKHTTDIQFIFENGDDVVKIPANRAVLAASSPVFNAMFTAGLKEEGDVKITDASPEAFQEFLQFFYDSQVKLTKENVAGVLKLLDKYDIDDGLPVCSDFLKKNVKIDDVLWALHLAVQFNLNDLKTFCEQTIGQNHNLVFDMINVEGGRPQVASDNRLSDEEMENILPHVFAILKAISSEMPDKSKPQPLPVTLVSTEISTKSVLRDFEEIEFSITKPMMLTDIKFSDIVILHAHAVAILSTEMHICTNNDRWNSNHSQNVVIEGGAEKTHLKLQPPLRIEHSKSCFIQLESSNIPNDLCTQKANVPNGPIELAPNISIRFENISDHSLISQLYFKNVDD